jgi:hypothetical protein
MMHMDGFHDLGTWPSFRCVYTHHWRVHLCVFVCVCVCMRMHTCQRIFRCVFLLYCVGPWKTDTLHTHAYLHVRALFQCRRHHPSTNSPIHCLGAFRNHWRKSVLRRLGGSRYVCICMYIHLYVCVYKHMYVCILHTCVYVYIIYVMHVCVCVYIYIYIYTPTYMNAYTCVYRLCLGAFRNHWR